MSDQKLIPREYQLHLLNRAIEKNTIVVLETGSGKTYIAVMLIQDVFMKQNALQLKKKKLTCFISNQIHLVFQQAKVIRTNLSLNVFEIVGSMEPELWKQHKWQDILQTNDVLVLTAQILLTALRCGFLSPSDFNLWIFDECHHTTKRHPFQLIMKEFYHTAEIPQRPKIFGMTASPINGKGKIELAGEQLESNLDATICTIVDRVKFQVPVNEPMETLILYDPYKPSPLIGNAMGLLHHVEDLLGKKDKFIDTLKNASTEILTQFGEFGLSLFLNHTMRSRFKLVQNNALTHHLMTLYQYTNESEFKSDHNQDKVSWKRVEKLLNKFKFDYIDVKRDLTNTEEYTPKLIEFFKLLQNVHQKDRADFRGIIFVQKRITAITLHLILEQFRQLRWIKSDYLLGHNDCTLLLNSNMAHNHQVTKVNNFRSGATNLLICTSVAEEGMDIQQCNLVVRFDAVKSLISYIQTRGRARQQDSQFYFLAEKTNVDNSNLIQELSKLEDDMLEWCQKLPEDRKLMLDSDIPVSVTQQKESQLAQQYVYKVESTEAVLTLDSAIGLIYQYCNSLPHDNFVSNAPAFEVVHRELDKNLFRFNLSLPKSSALARMEGEMSHNDRTAKQIVSFKACIELHKLGALSDHLLPVKDTPNILMALDHIIPPPVLSDAIEGSWRAVRKYNVDPAGIFNEHMGENVFIHYIDFSELPPSLEASTGYQDIGIMTFSPLPEIPPITLFIKELPYTVCVKSKTFKRSQFIFPNGIAFLKSYTKQCLMMVTNQLGDRNSDYFNFAIAPIRSDVHFNPHDDDTYIDWKEIHDFLQQAPVPATLNLLKPYNSILSHTNYKDSLFVYVSEFVDSGFGSASPEDSSIDDDELNDDDVYESLETQSQTICANHIRRVYNYLNRPNLPPNGVDLKLNPVPEYPVTKSTRKIQLDGCSLVPLTYPMVKSILMIPSFLSHLNALSLTQSVIHRLDFPELDPNLVVQAITAAQANLPYSLERLEFLGDAFLKMCTATYIFSKFPQFHEGILTDISMRFVHNKTLYRLAIDLGLQNFLVNSPINKKDLFSLGSLDFPDKRFQPIYEKEIPDKTLSDMIESLLGASLLSSGEISIELGLKCAIQMNMPFANDISYWEDMYMVYLDNNLDDLIMDQEKIEISNTYLKNLENLLGYEFNHPILLCQALTHSSSRKLNIPTYQRLEFLGDGILDFLTISYLYFEHPSLPPGRLHYLKRSCVNKYILSMICVKLELYKYLDYFNPALSSQISQFVNQLTHLSKSDPDFNPTKLYALPQPPKVLSDIVESCLAAIYLDSLFCISTVFEVFEKIILPVLTKHVSPDKILFHPNEELLHFMQKFGCSKFQLETGKTEIRPVKGGQSIAQVQTILSIHSKQIDTNWSTTAIEGQKKLVDKFFERLSKDANYLKKRCNCKK